MMTTRDRVRALLLVQPGLTTTEAARSLGLDRTTARYHLRQLAKARHAIESGAKWFPPRQARQAPLPIPLPLPIPAQAGKPEAE